MEIGLSMDAARLPATWTGILVASPELTVDSALAAAWGRHRPLHPGAMIGAEDQRSLRHSEGERMQVAVHFEAAPFGAAKIGVRGERSEVGGCLPIVHLGWVLPLREGRKQGGSAQ